MIMSAIAGSTMCNTILTVMATAKAHEPSSTTYVEILIVHLFHFQIDVTLCVDVVHDLNYITLTFGFKLGDSLHPCHE